LRLALGYAFTELHTKRVVVRVLDYNERAIGLYRSSGFREFERVSSGVVVDGVEHDDILMDLRGIDFGF
jgi:RimJ/RimL family protein N-acetyltransferase